MGEGVMERDYYQDFAVEWTPGPGAASVEFKVFEINHQDGDALMYPRKGWSNLPSDVTPNTADAAVYLSGFIKFDGCATLHFPDSIHLCGTDGWAQQIGLLRYLFDRAPTFLQSWDEEPLPK